MFMDGNGGNELLLIETSGTTIYTSLTCLGNITGDVVGDVTGNLIGNVTASNVGTVDMTATGTSNIQVPNNTVSSDNKIPFIGGGGTQGNILSNASFIYNPSSQVLSVPSLTASTAITCNGTMTVSSGEGVNGNATLIIESDTDNAVENSSPQLHMKKDGGACQYFIKGSNEQETSSTTAENNLILEIDDSTGTNNAMYFNINNTELLKIAPTLTTINNDVEISGTKKLTVHEVICDEFEVTGQNFKLDIPLSGIPADLAIPCWNGVVSSTNQNPDQRLRHKGTVFSFNPSTSLMKCPDITSSGTINANILNATTFNPSSISSSGDITTTGNFQYSNGTASLPINYTQELLGGTSLMELIDDVASGANQGNYGNTILSITRIGMNAKAYGKNYRAFTWNAYNTGLNIPTTFTCQYTGFWEIYVSFRFQTTSSVSSNRVNPIIRMLLNNVEQTSDNSSMPQYIRHQVGRHGTVVYRRKMRLSATNTLKFKTRINYGGTVDYSSIVSSSLFEIDDLKIGMTFLGNLTSNDIGYNG
jgi:hypothetical protein